MTKEECVALLYRYAEYDGLGIPNLAGCREAMKMAADLLSQPSISSNLDEAANRQAALEQPYKWEEEQDGSFGVTPLFVMSNIRSAFKAGVEWKAEQGETQIVETKAVFDSHGVDYGGRYLYVDLPDDTPIGTEFIVQIRKKQ